MAYDNETYLQSLAKQRADVDRQVANTRREVTRQRDAALGQLAKLPGAVNKATAAGRTQANTGLQGATAGASKLGLAGLLGGTFNASRAEVSGRMNDIAKAYGKTGGLMRKGFLEQADQRIGQVDTISKQLYGDLDSKRNQYIAQREAEDRQRALQEELARRQEAAQRAAMAQQAALAQQQMAHQASLAQQQRDHQQKQAMQGWLHEARKNRSFKTDAEGVKYLYQKGYAPPGMSLQQFGDYLGIQIPKPTSKSTYRSGGHQVY